MGAFLLLAPAAPAPATTSGCGIAQINADFACTFDIEHSDGSAYDLTGAALEMQVKNQTGSTAAATYSTGNGTLIVQSPATAGVVLMSVPAATMATLAPGTYYWDILLTTGPNVTLLGGGTWRVGPGVTNSATPLPPQAAPLSGGSNIVVTVSNPSLTLALLPSGPPGTGASYPAQPTPGTPLTGSLLYVDNADGWLKSISSNGTITEIAPP